MITTKTALNIALHLTNAGVKRPDLPSFGVGILQGSAQQGIRRIAKRHVKVA
jgi:hypothetical protein